LDQLLKGRNVLITGGGRNIGRSVAIEMARVGANVYFTEIDKERCGRLEKELTGYEALSRGVIADITSSSDTDKLCSWLSKERINIDILVNNVGTNYEKMLHERSLVDRMIARVKCGTKGGRRQLIWREIYETNVFGPVRLTDAISETMVRNGIQGSIIFITSIHQWSVRRDAPYSSSKAALGMLINELAVSLAPHKIRVNGIAPGYVEEDEQGEALGQRHSLLYKSSINPCYIGRAAVYLASEYFSRFTTGTVLKIDAGVSLYNHMVSIDPPE
jgi:NAD(P)-dependent dehydrogenase (short-subunit alcohol dehydrogenase family)